MKYTLEYSARQQKTLIVCQESFGQGAMEIGAINQKLAEVATGIQLVSASNYEVTIYTTQFAEIDDVQAKIIKAIAEHFGIQLDQMELVESVGQQQAREKREAAAAKAEEATAAQAAEAGQTTTVG